MIEHVPAIEEEGWPHVMEDSSGLVPIGQLMFCLPWAVSFEAGKKNGSKQKGFLQGEQTSFAACRGKVGAVRPTESPPKKPTELADKLHQPFCTGNKQEKPVVRGTYIDASGKSNLQVRKRSCAKPTKMSAPRLRFIYPSCDGSSCLFKRRKRMCTSATSLAPSPSNESACCQKESEPSQVSPFRFLCQAKWKKHLPKQERCAAKKRKASC